MTLLHPRTDYKGRLVSCDQMVPYTEYLHLEHRILFLTGVIGQHCGQCGTGESESHNLLMALDAVAHEPITLIITSPGGDLDLTLLFYDTMRSIKSPVITIGRFCGSGAAIILAAGSKRYLYPHAKTMLHLPAGVMSGDAAAWKIQQAQMEKYKQTIIDVLKECGVHKSAEEILQDIDREFWLDAREAIKYGLADAVMTTEVWQSLLKGD